jgi:hypothetical protein
MKWFSVSCAALVVGILLVGSVHAGKQRSSHRTAHRSRHHSGHHRRMHRPRVRHIRWQRLPQQPQDPGASDLNPGGYFPDSGGDVPIIVPNGPIAGGPGPASGGLGPNAEAYDQNDGGYNPGGDAGGANAARPAVPPKGGQPAAAAPVRQ